MWAAYVVGTIIGVWGQVAPPPGWRDITGTDRCRITLERFAREHPTAGDPPTNCLLKVEPDPAEDTTS